MQEIVCPTNIENLWLIPSDPGLHETERMLATVIGKETRLRQALRVARTHFDVIVVDCPPNNGTLTVNALVAADRVLIPCDLGVLSLDGVTSALETIETVQDTLNPSLALLGVLRTRVDRRNHTVNATIERQLHAGFGDWLLKTDIGTSTTVVKAQIEGRTVYQHSPSRTRLEKLCETLPGDRQPRLWLSDRAVERGADGRAHHCTQVARAAYSPARFLSQSATAWPVPIGHGRRVSTVTRLYSASSSPSTTSAPRVARTW